MRLHWKLYIQTRTHMKPNNNKTKSIRFVVSVILTTLLKLVKHQQQRRKNWEKQSYLSVACVQFVVVVLKNLSLKLGRSFISVRLYVYICMCVYYLSKTSTVFNAQNNTHTLPLRERQREREETQSIHANGTHNKQPGPCVYASSLCICLAHSRSPLCVRFSTHNSIFTVDHKQTAWSYISMRKTLFFSLDGRSFYFRLRDFILYAHVEIFSLLLIIFIFLIASRAPIHSIFEIPKTELISYFT